MSPEPPPERISADEPAPPNGTSNGGTASNDPRVGSVIAERYRVVAPLATGGMGMVYEGEHVALRRRVAVKFLHPELSRIPEVVARFEREAVAAAALDHPNVVGVTDFGRTLDGSFFLVMEFIEGRTLRAVLDREGRLPFPRALRIARQVGAALTRAHALGIVHRDLKPENVMLTDRDGAADGVKVVDFGIAKIPPTHIAPATPATPSAPAAPSLTLAGRIYGTPDYMPPEQALGAEVDAGADQYAFGVVLFEMLTGTRPFHGDDVATLLQSQVSAPPPRASAVCPGAFPPALDDVLARMLAKRSADRFPALADAMAALDAAAPPAASNAAAAPPPVPSGDPASAAEHLRRGGAILARRAAALVDRGWARAAPLRGRRWLLGAGGAATGALLLALLATRHGPARTAAPPAGSLPRPIPVGSDPASSRPTRGGATEPPPPAGRDVHQRLREYLAMPAVVDLMVRARAGEAGVVLLRFEETYETTHDGVVAYVAGTMATQARRHDRAVHWFEVALRSEPALADDPVMAQDVVRAECAHHPPPAAEALLAGPLAAEATPLLVDEALRSHPSACRERAGRLLRSPPLAARLDAEVATLLDLRDAPTCEARRSYVVALGRTGGARSLAWLQRLPTAPCAPRVPTCNACLTDVLPGAMDQIRRRAGPQ